MILSNPKCSCFRKETLLLLLDCFAGHEIWLKIQIQTSMHRSTASLQTESSKTKEYRRKEKERESESERFENEVEKNVKEESIPHSCQLDTGTFRRSCQQRAALDRYKETIMEKMCKQFCLNWAFPPTWTDSFTRVRRGIPFANSQWLGEKKIIVAVISIAPRALGEILLLAHCLWSVCFFAQFFLCAMHLVHLLSS